MRKHSNIRALGAIFFWCVLPLGAQYIDASKLPGSAPGEGRAAFSHRVTLDVVVTDKSGKAVPGLEQSDFTVIDDKQPQKLVSFEAFQDATANPPTEVVMLLDRINIPFGLFAQERIAVKKFVTRNGGKLEQPVSMIVLADDGMSTQPATRDGNVLAAAVDKIEASLRTVNRSQGAYGAMDRFQMSLSAVTSLAGILGQKPGRKLLIWISPGWPMLSGPQVQLTTKEQQGLFNGAVNISTALRQARVTLDSIDPVGVADAASVRTDYYKEFVKGVARPRSMQAGNLALQVLAEQSGGRVLNSSNDLAREMANCTMDADAWYVISFEAPPSDGPDEYHSLEVKLGKKGLTARTRTGYYDEP